MKVYVVKHRYCDYDEHDEVRGIFSAEALAIAMAARMAGYKPYDRRRNEGWCVEVWDVDELDPYPYPEVVWPPELAAAEI